ncbi:MAG: phosphate/phosphite/phosphonate ABC transporter substrate-binding protein [Calditrichaeota bacterium]|nr:MAG: phosphate/phosphite/phosphonate ABC transporter substrate-binding protein [Calditrichota bacterium]
MKPFTIVLLSAILFFSGCQEEEGYQEIDLNQRATYEDLHPTDGSKVEDSPLVLAIASIVSAKESFSAYADLIPYLEKKLHRLVHPVYTKNYREVYDLLEHRKVDIAFVCCGLYALGKRNDIMELLAIPVVNGDTKYQAYIIASKTSGIESINDLEGKTIALTDELSLSGCFYLLYGKTRNLISRDQVVFSGSHDASIQLVNRGIVDAASVDGLIYEEIAARRPQSVQNVRIVEKSPPFGIPPVVIHPRVPPTQRERIQTVLLQMNEDPEGLSILQRMGIEKFELPNEENYRTVFSFIPDSLTP